MEELKNRLKRQQEKKWLRSVRQKEKQREKERRKQASRCGVSNPGGSAQLKLKMEKEEESVERNGGDDNRHGTNNPQPEEEDPLRNRVVGVTSQIQDARQDVTIGYHQDGSGSADEAMAILSIPGTALEGKSLEQFYTVAPPDMVAGIRVWGADLYWLWFILLFPFMVRRMVVGVSKEMVISLDKINKEFYP